MKLTPIMDYLKEQASYRVGDLPEILTQNAKLVLAKNLIKNGLMRIESFGEPPKVDPKAAFLNALQLTE